MLRTSKTSKSVRCGAWLKRAVLGAVVAALLVDTFGLRQAAACPFCSAAQMTLSEDIKANDVAVICKLVARPPEQAADAPPEASQCTFEIIQTIKGGEVMAKQADPKKIKILYFGEQPIGSKFLAFGINPMNLAWGTPTLLSERAIAYVAKLPGLPAGGPQRLAFFQDYFEDADSLLAADSYDEFAKAPYADLKGLKDRMQHDKLIAWIKDPAVSTSRRRLYLCMISVCGKADDVAFLEAMIRNTDRQIRTALDAMIGSYLALKGPEGMPLIEDLFLKNSKSEYTDTYSAIMALRFIGQESDVISRERLKEGMRHMLDQPKLADLIVPDLTRWEDWTVMDRLVKLFKDADPDSAWIRLPVINYLRACPLPEAKVRLEELAKLDPEVVKRAMNYYPTPAADASATGTPKTTEAATPATTVPPTNPGAGS
ncbi:MAG: hypothetical protein K8U03_26940 [Planctomycetia bacterium]|nr:hypothetical protein [Planctomycetia bacterium]